MLENAFIGAFLQLEGMSRALWIHLGNRPIPRARLCIVHLHEALFSRVFLHCEMTLAGAVVVKKIIMGWFFEEAFDPSECT